MLNMFASTQYLPIYLLLTTILSVNGYSIGKSVEKLTKCSNFDYEEKLLQKVIRLEHSIDLERKLKQFEDMLGEKLIRMESVNSEKQKKLEQINSEKLEEMENKTNAILTRLSEEGDRRKKSFKKQKKEFAVELRSQKHMLVEAIQKFTVNSKDIEDRLMDNQTNLLKAFERNLNTHTRKFDESTAEMNATFSSFLTTAKQKTEKQQQSLADVMHDVKLNSSLLGEKLLNQQKEKEYKVVLVGCMIGSIYYSSGSTYIFRNIITKVGLPGLTDFSSTGKFICPAKGIYHISAVIRTDQDYTYIDVMKNSVRMHYQLVNGNGDSNWTPGTVILALELNVNDTVWIKARTSANLYYSCLTIFKL